MYKFRKFISYSVISVFIAIVIIAVTSIMIYKALDKASYVPILCAILNAV